MKKTTFILAARNLRAPSAQETLTLEQCGKPALKATIKKWRQPPDKRKVHATPQKSYKGQLLPQLQPQQYGYLQYIGQPRHSRRQRCLLFLPDATGRFLPNKGVRLLPRNRPELQDEHGIYGRHTEWNSRSTWAVNPCGIQKCPCWVRKWHS